MPEPSPEEIVVVSGNARLPKGLLRRKAHRRHDHVDALAHSALGHDHDHANLSSSSDDAFFPTTGDEIMKKLSPLVPGPYYMPYPYVEGSSVNLLGYGSGLLILLPYAPSMPPMLSLTLSMACDDSDGCAMMTSITNGVFFHGVPKLARQPYMVQDAVTQQLSKPRINGTSTTCYTMDDISIPFFNTSHHFRSMDNHSLEPGSMEHQGDTSGGIICWESWRCKTPNPITRDLKPPDKKKKSKMKKLNWKQQLL
ncbi:hypothetical protein Tco_1464965 [Tanacetum coccineum]